MKRVLDYQDVPITKNDVGNTPQAHYSFGVRLQMPPMPTRLCVPITVRSFEQASIDIKRSVELGAELIELCVDTFIDPQSISRLVSLSTIPTIVTCRSADEGGEATISDEERRKLLCDVGQQRALHLDIEWQTVNRHSWDSPCKSDSFRSQWIYSAHDFKSRPQNLHQLMEGIFHSQAHVAKVAWRARSVRDNIEAFELMSEGCKPTVAICMGEAGTPSRILAKKFGAFLSFATLSPKQATAPGQLTIREMKEIYRWDALGPTTKVYGVVGSPVGHSMSPAIHNASFERIGFDGVYVPLLVEPSYESFKAFMETFLAFKPLHLRGLSVTIPHKENALCYLKEKQADVDPLAERIGAINTIVIGDDGALRGFSSDHAAILDSITAALNIERSDLVKYRVAVLGAGGTGRTAVAALAECGATVVVYNRTFERAEALASEFNGKHGKVVAAKFEKMCDSCCQIFINTTSVGMTPKVDASPIDGTGLQLDASHLVFDTIYTPQETKLLAVAKAAGAKTIGGAEMFVRQAAAQFEAWTGQPAPRELMRQVLDARLAR